MNAMTKKINTIFNFVFVAIWVAIFFVLSVRDSTKFGGHIETIFQILSVLMVITAPFSLFSYILTKLYPFVIKDSVMKTRLNRNPIQLLIWREVLEAHKDNEL